MGLNPPGKTGPPSECAVASRIETGRVYINHPTWTNPELPFRRIKNSGYGRELSSLGIPEFVNKKLGRVESIDASVSHVFSAAVGGALRPDGQRRTHSVGA